MFKITCCGTVKVCLPSVSKQPKNKKIINTTTFYYKFFITINSFQAKSDLNLLILSLLSKLIFWVTTWCWWPFKLLMAENYRASQQLNNFSRKVPVWIFSLLVPQELCNLFTILRPPGKSLFPADKDTVKMDRSRFR